MSGELSELAWEDEPFPKGLTAQEWMDWCPWAIAEIARLQAKNDELVELLSPPLAPVLEWREEWNSSFTAQFGFEGRGLRAWVNVRPDRYGDETKWILCGDYEDAEMEPWAIRDTPEECKSLASSIQRLLEGE